MKYVSCAPEEHRRIVILGLRTFGVSEQMSEGEFVGTRLLGTAPHQVPAIQAPTGVAHALLDVMGYLIEIPIINLSPLTSSLACR
jgi:hypothetical protein